MSKKSFFLLGGTFFYLFLLLTPLGLFNDWVPPRAQTGYYSVTQIDAGDDTGYYAYLRSLFFDADWDFINERNYAHADKLTPTGYTFNNWQIGQAVLFFPFFCVGHGLAWLYGALGYPVAADGYSAPYYLATAVASGTWLFAGLLLVFHILKQYAVPRTARLATLSMWIGSPLLYFTFIRQRMAHTVEFFVSAAFVWAWLRFRRSENALHHALLGGLLGFLCTIRVLNGVFFVLYAADLLYWTLKDDRHFLSERLRTMAGRLAVFFGGWGVLMLPQMMAWYQLNGVPWPSRHLHFAGEGLAGFSLSGFFNNLAALFFDPAWGLLLSMPLALCGLVGLCLKTEALQSARPALLAVVAAWMGVIVLYPEDSASYGQRHLISLLPVFSLGLALLLQRASAVKFRWWLSVAGAAFLAMLQYFMIVQYKVTLPYNDPEFSRKAIAAVPQLLWERAELLSRSTNFFRLLLFDHPAGVDFRDVLFTMIFPLMQLVCVLLLGGAVLRSWGTGDFWQRIRRPRVLAATAGVLSLVAVGVVLAATPPKSEQDIEIRQTYLDRIHHGDSLLQTSQTEHARTAYKEAANLMPEQWMPYFKIAVTYNMQGKLHMANTFYERGLELNPGHSVALTNWGSNLYVLGKLEEAEIRLQSALRAWPLNKTAYDLLAQVYVRLDRLEEAETHLLSAVAIDPNYAAGHANLAVVYTLLDRSDRARSHLDAALRLGISGPGIQKLVDHFKQNASGTAGSQAAVPAKEGP